MVANERPGLLVAILLLGLLGAVCLASAQELTASKGSVRMSKSDETTANATLTVKNPTMYDVYLVSASTEAAGKVEFRKANEGGSDPVRELTVPAYGSLTLGLDTFHLRLADLKRPLRGGESILVKLRTDGSQTIESKLQVLAP